MKEMLYKCFALLALSAALALGLITLHFWFGEADITVLVRQTPKNATAEVSIPIVEREEVVTQNGAPAVQPAALEESESALAKLRKAVLGVSTEKDNAAKLEARVKMMTISVERTLSLEGEGVGIDDYAEGSVTLYNEQSVNQPLIVKTRLMAPDESIFRMQNPVIVPARGSIAVSVKADKKGAAFNLEPTAFTIPGLSPSKQKRVYAKSSVAFTGGVRRIHTLTEDDFVHAHTEAVTLLKKKALEQFNAQGIVAASSNILLDAIAFKTKDAAGEGKSALAFTAETRAYAVLFNEQALRAEMERRLAASIPREEEIIGFNDASFAFSLADLGTGDESVSANAYIEGFTSLKKDAEFIAPADLAGLSAKEIQARISAHTGVSEVSVRFSPFWITRAPRIAGKIHIVIK